MHILAIFSSIVKYIRTYIHCYFQIQFCSVKLCYFLHHLLSNYSFIHYHSVIATRCRLELAPKELTPRIFRRINLGKLRKHMNHVFRLVYRVIRRLLSQLSYGVLPREGSNLPQEDRNA